MIEALKIYTLCACRGGGGAERVKPLIRAPAPDRGLRSCETLRWVCGGQSGRGAWNCLRSGLARACGSSALGLSASGYRSAGGHKNESNTELSIASPPECLLTSEEPGGFSDELILPRGNKSREAPDPARSR